MKKDAYYFPHFSNARNDPKILRLRRIFGIEGYGIYFMLLEVLREQTDFCYPLDGIEDLAYEWHVPKELICSIISHAGLFTLDNRSNFYSARLIHYLKPYMEKTERARSAALKRWNEVKELPEHDANAMQMQYDGNTNAMQGEERRGEESIGDNIYTWRNDFKIYLSSLKDESVNLLSDDGFLKTQERFYPNVDIRLSIEKAITNFWGTEAGWKHKKKSRSKEIDWKSTLTNAINLNKVYKPRQIQSLPVVNETKFEKI